MTTACTLAFDIGGTKIASGLIADDAPTTVVDLSRHPSQPAGTTTAEVITNQLADLVAAADAHGWTPARVGFGAPGVVDVTSGRVLYAGPTMPGWQGTNLVELARTAVNLPAAACNDVRAHGLGEDTFAGHTTGRTLFLALGTGLGSAILQDGRLISSRTATAGEFSEVICADLDGLAQRAELVASGTGLTIYYNDHGHTRVRWRALTSADVRLPDIPHNNERLNRIIDGNLFGLGQAVGGLVTAADIQSIILGGGVAALGEAVRRPFARGVRAGALPPNHTVTIDFASLGEEAALIGAAHLARTTC